MCIGAGPTGYILECHSIHRLDLVIVRLLFGSAVALHIPVWCCELRVLLYDLLLEDPDFTRLANGAFAAIVMGVAMLLATYISGAVVMFKMLGMPLPAFFRGSSLGLWILNSPPAVPSSAPPLLGQYICSVVECSHSLGSLLSETQDEALDVGHCCNPKNNVNNVLQCLFDAFSQNAFHFSLIISHLMNWRTGCC